MEHRNAPHDPVQVGRDLIALALVIVVIGCLIAMVLGNLALLAWEVIA